MVLVQALIVLLGVLGMLAIGLYLVASCRGRDERGLAPPELRPAPRDQRRSGRRG
jgi:hypothetical protein